MKRSPFASIVPLAKSSVWSKIVSQVTKNPFSHLRLMTRFETIHLQSMNMFSEVDQDDCDDCSDGYEGCEEERDAEKDAVHKPRVRVFPVEAGDNAALDTADIVPDRMSAISMSVQNMWAVFEIVRRSIPEPDETVLVLS